MTEGHSSIVGICCNYAGRVSEEALREAGLLPEGVRIERLPCTGRLEVTTLLDAFEAGAEAVFVAGCEEGTCHNLSGSHRAQKKVGAAKGILGELDMDPGLVEMFFVPRGETGPIVAAAREMASRVAGTKKGQRSER
ncbi:MAG: hydrogenase iron-sulfur subunit [Deltaproteobacteria bacterium]